MKPKKFYAVVKGKTQGIFTEWSLCEDSIYRYNNAVYKGFADINSAIHFLIANRTFDLCCDIPVFVDFSVTNFVRDHEHKCSSDIVGEAQPTSESPEMEEDPHPESLVSDTDVTELKGLENKSIKEGLPARGVPPCGSFSSFSVEKPPKPPSKSKGDDSVPCSFCIDPTRSNVIQCADCFAWCHFTCTKLPAYQLFIYKSSTRKFKCAKC